MVSDPMAATVAENALYNLLRRRAEDRAGGSPRSSARAIVGEFDAHLEHRDGLRRVVLTGEWEVEPKP